MWQSYYRSSLIKPVTLEEFTVESDDEDDSEYNELCNTSISSRGYWNKICQKGLTKKILEDEGWHFKKTSGKNSFIFIKSFHSYRT